MCRKCFILIRDYLFCIFLFTLYDDDDDDFVRNCCDPIRRTLINKIISASSHAATLPDDVLHEASGIQLYCDQSHICEPVQFPASYGLTKLSADLFLTREAVPQTARLIVERHQLRVIPITRVVMSEGDRSFKFYIIGLDKEIYIKSYPSTCALCCCLQMCNVQ